MGSALGWTGALGNAWSFHCKQGVTHHLPIILTAAPCRCCRSTMWDKPLRQEQQASSSLCVLGWEPALLFIFMSFLLCGHIHLGSTCWVCFSSKGCCCWVDGEAFFLAQKVQAGTGMWLMWLGSWTGIAHNSCKALQEENHLSSEKTSYNCPSRGWRMGGGARLFHSLGSASAEQGMCKDPQFGLRTVNITDLAEVGWLRLSKCSCVKGGFTLWHRWLSLEVDGALWWGDSSGTCVHHQMISHPKLPCKDLLSLTLKGKKQRQYTSSPTASGACCSSILVIAKEGKAEFLHNGFIFTVCRKSCVPTWITSEPRILRALFHGTELGQQESLLHVAGNHTGF